MDASVALSKIRQENPNYQIIYIPHVAGIWSNFEFDPAPASLSLERQAGPPFFKPIYANENRSPALYYKIDSELSTVSLSSPLLDMEKIAYMFPLSALHNALGGAIDFDDLSIAASVGLTKIGTCFYLNENKNNDNKNNVVAFLAPRLSLSSLVRLQTPYRISIKSSFFLQLAELVLDGKLSGAASDLANYMREHSGPESVEIISSEDDSTFVSTVLLKQAEDHIADRRIPNFFLHGRSSLSAS